MTGFEDFRIKLEDVPIHKTSYDLKIDGRSYPGKVARKHTLGTKWERTMKGIATSATERYPYVFLGIASTGKV